MEESRKTKLRRQMREYFKRRADLEAEHLEELGKILLPEEQEFLGSEAPLVHPLDIGREI